MASLALLSIWVLVGPLTAIHADGARVRRAQMEQEEQPPPLKPEQVRFEPISTQDGLSESRVWGITQDRRGFLWFTTYDGINRYDGYEFKVYKHDTENPKQRRGKLRSRPVPTSSSTKESIPSGW